MKENKVKVPSDLSVHNVMYLMTGVEIEKGTGIMQVDADPVFVKKIEEPENAPGTLVVEATVKYKNGERVPFKFPDMNYHIPEKLKVGQIFLNEEDALKNLKEMAKQNLKKAERMLEPLKNLNDLIQNMTSLAPEKENKSKTINISTEKEQEVDTEIEIKVKKE